VNNEWFEPLVDSIGNHAIFRLDADGRIRRWNSGAERLSQYRRDEAVGRHLALLHLPEDIATGKPSRLLTAAARDGRVEDEGWRVRKDGSRFRADVVITALRDSQGRLLRFA